VCVKEWGCVYLCVHVCVSVCLIHIPLPLSLQIRDLIKDTVQVAIAAARVSARKLSPVEAACEECRIAATRRLLRAPLAAVAIPVHLYVGPLSVPAYFLPYSGTLAHVHAYAHTSNPLLTIHGHEYTHGPYA